MTENHSKEKGTTRHDAEQDMRNAIIIINFFFFSSLELEV